jgi:hypothetical protein
LQPGHAPPDAAEVPDHIATERVPDEKLFFIVGGELYLFHPLLLMANVADNEPAAPGSNKQCDQAQQANAYDGQNAFHYHHS